jgi:hypothetical protein
MIGIQNVQERKAKNNRKSMKKKNRKYHRKELKMKILRIRTQNHLVKKERKNTNKKSRLKRWQKRK